MSRTVLAILALLFMSIMVSIPAPSGAWSIDGHELITRQSIALLPDRWRQLFGYYDWFLTEASTYPDIYYRETDPNEGPRHYVDLEVWNPNAPSTGTLPQAVEEYSLKMQLAMEAGNWNNAFLLAGRLAHYVEDDTQPYHTTVDYNPTNKAGTGLHSVLDSSLAAHFSEINVLQASDIGALAPIDNLTTFALNLAYQSHSYLPVINRTLIDEGLDWSPELTKMIENRTNTAIIAVARVWYTVIMKAKVPAPEIPANNQLSIVIENVTQADNGLTSIQLRVVDSLGVRTYADVTLITNSSTYRGQVADVVTPMGEYVVVSDTGLHPDDRLSAQREGYKSTTVGLGIPATQVSRVDFGLPTITVVALVVMFGCIVIYVILRRTPMDS
jgi:hypothetical protein